MFVYYVLRTFAPILRINKEYATEKEFPSPLCNSRIKSLLDHHRVYHRRMVLPCCRTHRTHLYDRSCDDQHLEGTLVVWQCVSSRQHVRPSVVEVLTPQADTCVCAYFRFPTVHGVLYLQHVRHPTDINRSLERGRNGYVEWHWSRVLDDYRDDYHRRCYAEFHLCATHLVLVLPHGPRPLRTSTYRVPAR